MTKTKTKREYFRKCGCCGCRGNQRNMVRTNLSPNGWFCRSCYETEMEESYDPLDDMEMW